MEIVPKVYNQGVGGSGRCILKFFQGQVTDLFFLLQLRLGNRKS